MYRKSEAINQNMTLLINAETLDVSMLKTPGTQEPFILTNRTQEDGASRTGEDRLGDGK